MEVPMTTYDGASFLSTNTPSEEEFKSSLESFLAETKTLLGGMTPTQLTISTDVITPTRGARPVEVESSTTDNLANISTTNLEEGRLLLLWPASTGKTITVKHQSGGAGQIHLRDDVDVDLDETNNFIMLQRQGEDWYETIFLDDFTSQTSLKRLEATGEGVQLSQTNDVLDLNQGMVKIDELAGGADHTASGVVTTMTAGEDLLFGEVCYLNPTDGKLWKANAASLTEVPVFAMALEDVDVSVNASGNVLLSGFARDDTWDWTVGGPVYLDATAGALTQTAPTGSGRWVQAVGVATNADRIFFDLNRSFTQNEGELLQGFYPHGIAKSCLFVSGDSTNLSYTPASAGDQKKWTISFWVKRVNLPGNEALFIAGNSYIMFNGSNQFTALFYNSDTSRSVQRITTPVYRDPSSYLHVVVQVDTAQVVDADKMTIWINGNEITEFVASINTINDGENVQMSSTVAHSWGALQTTRYEDCYLAEACLCDGQAYSASDFGMSKNGIWCPKDISGLTFGTRGWHLDFVEALDLGKDVSGSGNNWSENNIGPANQSTDTPTNNFCTMNTLDSHPSITLSDGNLNVLGPSSGNSFDSRSTFAISESGKWYVEVELVQAAQNTLLGVAGENWDWIGWNTTNPSVLIDCYNGYKGDLWVDGTKVVDDMFGTNMSAGDIVMFALDRDNAKMWIGRNGAWYNSGNPAAEINETRALDVDATSISAGLYNSSSEVAWNFGNPPLATTIVSGNADDNGYGNFEYAPPTGFLALCSANMDEDEYVTSGSYTGNGNADGPFIYTGCYCDKITIDSVLYTQAASSDHDFLSNGVKVRSATTKNTASTSYNWSVASGDIQQDFKYANAQGN
jgi:hypothetical protein